MGILDSIDLPSGIRNIPENRLDEFCAEIRDFIIESVSKTGGHLASNLGVVELTVAIHRVFDTSRDRLVFDVGHQSYVHKILTGRKERFDTLRQFGGLSGFPKPSESVHDAFIAGHASTSVSAALGIARARTLSRSDYHVIALLGDGALTGGLAFEGLSDAGESSEPMTIILNDNGMAINGNVGGIARYLSRRRMRPSYGAFKKRYKNLMNKLPFGRAIYRFTHRVKTVLKEALFHCSMFEEMGLQYVGPIDGHNTKRIVEALEWAKRSDSPAVVHVRTQKGRGYEYSARFPEEYHSVSPFNQAIGIAAGETGTFSSVFGDELMALAEADPRICAVTASMGYGTGLSGFAARYPERFFDVGIAEGHAAIMASGMASRGAIPVFAVYSTFLQRSYDMLIHDIAISGAHVVFAVDRAGLVAGDGETHQGVFDVSFLCSIPGLTVFSPCNFAELRDMLDYAVEKVEGPVAIRYPRSCEGDYREGGINGAVCLKPGVDITLVTYGINVNTALEVSRTMAREGISVEVIKLGLISPIDFERIGESTDKTGSLVVLEECIERGSVGEGIAAKLSGRLISVKLLNTGNAFIPCGSISDLREHCGIDAKSVCSAIRAEIYKKRVACKRA